MAKSKATNSNTTTNEQPAHEASAAPPEPTDGGTAENPATVEEVRAEAPHVEAGPDEYACHPGARLLTEQAADLDENARLEAELALVRGRLTKRGHVIAGRAVAKANGTRNPTVSIGGRHYVPKARPAKHGGGMMLVELGARASVALD